MRLSALGFSQIRWPSGGAIGDGILVGHQGEKRGLASAVSADEAVDLSRFQGEVDMVENGLASVLLCEVFAYQLAHFALPPILSSSSSRVIPRLLASSSSYLLLRPGFHKHADPSLFIEYPRLHQEVDPLGRRGGIDGVELGQLIGAGHALLLEQNAPEDVRLNHLADLQIDGFFFRQPLIHAITPLARWFITCVINHITNKAICQGDFEKKMRAAGCRPYGHARRYFVGAAFMAARGAVAIPASLPTSQLQLPSRGARAAQAAA